jgi:hypothetical protein
VLAFGLAQWLIPLHLGWLPVDVRRVPKPF